jgi:hypothetical protein
MRPGPSCASLCIIFRPKPARKARFSPKTPLFKLLSDSGAPFAMLQNDTLGLGPDPLDFAGAAASQFKGKSAAREPSSEIRAQITANIIFEPMPMINQRKFVSRTATIRLPVGPVRRASMCRGW